MESCQFCGVRFLKKKGKNKMSKKIDSKKVSKNEEKRMAIQKEKELERSLSIYRDWETEIPTHFQGSSLKRGELVPVAIEIPSHFPRCSL